MKTLILIISLVSAWAAETNIQTLKIQPPIVTDGLTDTNKPSLGGATLANPDDSFELITNTPNIGDLFTMKSEPITNVWWHLADGHGELQFTISTNAVTNWVIIEKFLKGVPAALGATQFDASRQMGTIQSNLVLTVTHEKRTNQLILKTIGREEYPSQKRILKGGGGK